MKRSWLKRQVAAVIPDPEALAANLGADTLVLIVGGDQAFLVAVTGSPEIKARMIDAYREAGLPVRIAANSHLPGGLSDAPGAGGQTFKSLAVQGAHASQQAHAALI